MQNCYIFNEENLTPCLQMMPFINTEHITSNLESRGAGRLIIRGGAYSYIRVHRL